MKIWSVFSLVIIFHVAIIGLLLVQPGCQSQTTESPEPRMTTPTQAPAYEDSATLDPAFNTGVVLPSQPSSSQRNLSAPTRPEGNYRSEPDTGMLEPVLEPVTDTLTLAPETRDYTVKAGDSLIAIANREGVPLSALLAANGLTRNSTIYVGQTLRIPEGPGPDEGLSAEMEHSGKSVVVGRGDTLSGIAARNGTTVSIIKSLNGLTSDTIFVGQELLLPGDAAPSGSTGQRSTTVRSPGTATLSGNQATYTVKAGDTPSGIARQYGITSRELMAANNITDARKLFVGQKLVIPGQGSSNTGQQTQSVASPPPSSSPPPASPARQSTSAAQPVPQQTAPALDPASALEALEDEDLPFVEVEEVGTDEEPVN